MSNSQRFAAPCFCAGVGAARNLSLSSPSKMRGVARHKARPRRTLRVARVRAGPRVHQRMHPAPCGAPRGVPAFAFNGRRTRRLPIKPEGLPGGRPGMWVRTTPAGTASRPTLATPREVRPSVDGTTVTYSDYHQKASIIFTKCDWRGHADDLVDRRGR